MAWVLKEFAWLMFVMSGIFDGLLFLLAEVLFEGG